MIHRLLDRLESRPAGPAQTFLVFVAFILVRLQTEVLFLDADRTLDFFVFNLWYFLSLFLCFVLGGAALTGRTPEQVSRVMLPFSAVILLPLLDRFFYPHLSSEELLPLCRLPLYPEWKFYLQDLYGQMLSHRFFLNPEISLGLRLEVFAGALGVGAYVFVRAGSWKQGLLRGGLAYLVGLCVMYGHAVLVIHPATRRGIFLPLVLAELVVLAGVWHRGAFVAWLRRYAWVETLALAIAAAAGLSQHPAFGTLASPQIGNVVAGCVAMVFLGLFISAGKERLVADRDGKLDSTRGIVAGLAALGCLLAGFLAGTGAFPAFAMSLGLVFLVWFSPLRLVNQVAVYSVLAGVALWVNAWAGYASVQLPNEDSPAPPAMAPPMPRQEPPGNSVHGAGRFGSPPPVTEASAPQAGSPGAAQVFGGPPGPTPQGQAPRHPLPPGDFRPTPSSRPGGRPSGNSAERSDALPMPFMPPLSPGSAPMAPGPGAMPPGAGPRFQPAAATSHPDWLCHPGWLGVPVVVGGLTLAGRRWRWV